MHLDGHGRLCDLASLTLRRRGVPIRRWYVINVMRESARIIYVGEATQDLRIRTQAISSGNFGLGRGCNSPIP